MPKISLITHLFSFGSYSKSIQKLRRLLSAPIFFPDISALNKKYKSGTILGKYTRHLASHKKLNKLLNSSLAMMFFGIIFIPQAGAQEHVPEPSDVVVESKITLKTEKGVQYPLDTIKINQRYSFFHPAVDFGGRVGTTVRPIKKGVVAFAGHTKDGYGNNVVINHGQGISSLYAHLSEIAVKQGQEVTSETKIGSVGVSGRTTGPHLHIEIRQDGKNINPLSVLH